MNLNEAIQIIKQHGYKYTGKRVDMLEFLSENDRYLTAKEILNNMRDRYPQLSFDTVYRNLSLFSELGILETTELFGERHYRFLCDIKHHHHHFICLECGKTKEIETCPMDEISAELKDYTIKSHKFEIYGYCNTCA